MMALSVFLSLFPFLLSPVGLFEWPERSSLFPPLFSVCSWKHSCRLFEHKLFFVNFPLLQFTYEAQKMKACSIGLCRKWTDQDYDICQWNQLDDFLGTRGSRVKNTECAQSRWIKIDGNRIGGMNVDFCKCRTNNYEPQGSWCFRWGTNHGHISARHFQFLHSEKTLH